MLVILTEKIDIVVGISHCGVVVELVSMSAAAKSSSVFQVSRMELACASSKDELLDPEIRFALGKMPGVSWKGRLPGRLFFGGVLARRLQAF